ncbi:divalent-cation tolerance protein CutA [Microlunatus sp. GCM10028923]|uniref:divalent-cation tolerance protein CutA n=1 Tax=Microlunatus sp. GCM10028923 TaxID=3273400 RepID=UPI00361AF5D1
MTDQLVAVTTTDSEEEAGRIADGLVAARLAACVQVAGPVRSVYRWQGELHSEREWQLWIKTAADRQDAVIAWIEQHHSYDVPELVFLPISAGLPAYLDWIVEETRH